MSVRLLDGGMGQEVFRRLGEPAGGWPALAALDRPDVVRDLHEEYLAAGAEIVTTYTYALGRWRMNRNGLWDRFGAANTAACRLAGEARDATNPAALVAGSIGPVRASYQPDAVPPPAVVEREVAEQALVLAPHVDLLLCETMSTAAEAAAAARAALATGLPVWVAFTLDERGRPTLRSGESIAEAVRALDGLAVHAILLNCTTPEAIDAGLPELVRAARGLPVGAYANAFEPVPDDVGFGTPVHHIAKRDLSPDAYARHAARWLDAGATILGGCCEVGPNHIATLRSLIDDRAH